MNSLNKINDINAKDPFDILIIEKGLRAIDLKLYKKHDLMIVFLNTGKTEQLNISEFPELAKATERILKQYKLVHIIFYSDGKMVFGSFFFQFIENGFYHSRGKFF